MALAPDELDFASSCFGGSGLGREAEMLARRRRAAPLEVAIMAVTEGKLEVCEMKVGALMAQRRASTGINVI